MDIRLTELVVSSLDDRLEWFWTHDGWKASIGYEVDRTGCSRWRGNVFLEAGFKGSPFTLAFGSLQLIERFLRASWKSYLISWGWNTGGSHCAHTVCVPYAAWECGQDTSSIHIYPVVQSWKVRNYDSLSFSNRFHEHILDTHFALHFMKSNRKYDMKYCIESILIQILH